MKQVPFRMIDRVFIKISINDKMWAVFALFFITLSALAGARYINTITNFETQAKQAVEYKLQGIISQNPHYPDPGIRISRCFARYAVSTRSSHGDGSKQQWAGLSFNGRLLSSRAANALCRFQGAFIQLLVGSSVRASLLLDCDFLRWSIVGSLHYDAKNCERRSDFPLRLSSWT